MSFYSRLFQLFHDEGIEDVIDLALIHKFFNLGAVEGGSIITKMKYKQVRIVSFVLTWPSRIQLITFFHS